MAVAELRKLCAHPRFRALFQSFSPGICQSSALRRRQHYTVGPTSMPVLISLDYGNRRCFRHLTSAARPPVPPDDLVESAAAAGERGLKILRQNPEALSQDEAMEAWHCLLKATCTTENEPRASRDVYFALGNLHYLWGELLERGKKAELGAEGAARAVVAEVKALRRRALQKRAEATRASKKKPPGLRVEDDGTKSSSGQESSSLTTSDDGDAVKVRHPQAWEWYLKAAEEGDSRAMMQLGEIAMEAAMKSSATAQLAEKWYRRSAAGDQPQPDALFQLARMHHEGIGMPPNVSLARELYEEACEARSSAAAYFLGHSLHVGDEELGIDVDCARALALLSQACEQGHAEAIYYLAQAHRSGSAELGLPQDFGKFRDMVQQAAAAGSADAMFAIGAAFFHGEDGFPRNPQAAFRYYAAAAGLGHADASHCLGVMHYAMGNLETAFRCYQTAAEGGNMLSWRNIASMYALGEGVPRSEQMAKHIMTTLGNKIDMQDKEGEGEKETEREKETKPGDA